MKAAVHTNVVNYYGEVVFTEVDGKYFLELESWDGYASVEISKELYEAAAKEFGTEVDGKYFVESWLDVTTYEALGRGKRLMLDARTGERKEVDIEAGEAE